MAERSFGQRLSDFGEILATRGVADPVGDREREERERMESQAAARSKKDQFVLKTSMKFWEAHQQNGGTWEDFPQRLQGPLIKAGFAGPEGGLDIAQPQPEMKTEVGRATQEISALQSQLDRIDTSTPAGLQRAAQLEDAIMALNAEVSEAGQPEPIKLERIDRGAFVEWYEEGNPANVVHRKDKVIRGNGVPKADNSPLVRVVVPGADGEKERTMTMTRREFVDDKELRAQGAQAFNIGTGTQGTITEMGFDDQGRPITRIGRPDDLTVRSQSLLQNQSRQLTRSILEATELLKGPDSLRAGDVGVPGVFREFIGRTIGQFIPGIVSSDVLERRRTLQIFREGALKLVSQDSRFSNVDRAAIERLFPEDGVFESIGRARAALTAWTQIASDRAALWEGELGRKPLDQMTAREIYESKDLNDVIAKRALKSLFTREELQQQIPEAFQ